MALPITILLTEEPLAPPPPPSRECGAVVDFAGVVRGEEDGAPIAALEYQAYSPMAERELERLVRELLEEFPCLEIYVAHRVGLVPVGEAAIVLRVTARHRGPAFSFASAFMDRLKVDVPIWKIRALPRSC